MNPANTPIESGHAPVNGLQMYYELHGEGGPLVLIHGGGSTVNSTFGRFIPLLAPHFRLIAVELQGHGRTSQRAEQESFEQDADDVAALLDHLGISAFHVLGFSNGGSTALQLAIRHPQRVRRLVALSAATKRSGFMDGFFAGMQLGTIDQIPARLKADFLDVNNDPAALHAMFEQDRNRMLLFRDWPEEQLRAITQPVFLASTDKDVILPQHTLEMAALLPHAQVAILPGPHGACIGESTIEKPDSMLVRVFSELVKGFLE